MAGDLHLVGGSSRLPIQELGPTPDVPDQSRMTVMGSQQERTGRIEALRGLIERLSAPDLTLADAKVVRGCISDLLERDNPPAGPPCTHPGVAGSAAQA